MHILFIEAKKSLMGTLRLCMAHTTECFRDSESETQHTIHLHLDEIFQNIPMNSRQNSVSVKMKYISVNNVDKHTTKKLSIQRHLSVQNVGIPSVM